VALPQAAPLTFYLGSHVGELSLILGSTNNGHISPRYRCNLLSNGCKSVSNRCKKPYIHCNSAANACNESKTAADSLRSGCKKASKAAKPMVIPAITAKNAAIAAQLPATKPPRYAKGPKSSAMAVLRLCLGFRRADARR
jgi:hypothetical protein